MRRIMYLQFLFLCAPILAKYHVSTEYKAKSFNYRQRFLVMHYTVADLQRSLNILTGNSVSSHYVIPETPINGKRKIYQLVPENKRAWTQGISQWGSRSNLNDQGVSLEIVNRGYVKNNTRICWFPYPDYQIQTVIQLSKDIIARYKIGPVNVVGHSDVSPGRKVDPGPLFPWKQLYHSGIGAWPNDNDVRYFKKKLLLAIDLKIFQKDLRKYGYKTNTNGIYTTETKDAVVAFQMHFRPSKYDGVIDSDTYAILKALLKKYF